MSCLIISNKVFCFKTEDALAKASGRQARDGVGEQPRVWGAGQAAGEAGEQARS